MRRDIARPSTREGLPAATEAQQRILLLSVAGLGDFVMATPALRAIRRHFPEAVVCLLTIPEVGPLAERCPYVDVVRTVDLRRSRSLFWWAFGRGRREIWELIGELRARRFDLAVNLYSVGSWMGGLRMAIFLRAIGVRYSVGRRTGRCGFGYDLTSRAEGHEVEAQLDAVRLVGASPVGNLPELWVTPDDQRSCSSLLAAHGVLPDDRPVGIHAGSARPEACWPADRFAQVGQALASEGARVLLIGGKAQHTQCLWLAEAIPGAIFLAGETTLPVLAALLQRMAVLVSNDSGPMHMAAALGVPLVVPFGPADPARFGPRGRAPHLVFSSGDRPRGAPWWEGISVEEVSRAAVHLFREACCQAGPSL